MISHGDYAEAIKNGEESAIKLGEAQRIIESQQKQIEALREFCRDVHAYASNQLDLEARPALHELGDKALALCEEKPQ